MDGHDKERMLLTASAPCLFASRMLLRCRLTHVNNSVLQATTWTGETRSACSAPALAPAPMSALKVGGRTTLSCRRAGRMWFCKHWRGCSFNGSKMCKNPSWRSSTTTCPLLTALVTVRTVVFQQAVHERRTGARFRVPSRSPVGCVRRVLMVWAW